jgi:pimeloyl-ACP methyl ester carboxylesterase
MRTRLVLSLGLLAALSVTTPYAQDIAGDWQGTLKTGSQQLRTVVQIAKHDGGGWKATLYALDPTTNAISVNSVTLDGSKLKLTVDAVHGVYEGKISADGTSISGTWIQGEPVPLELRRATKETAWPLDPSPHSVRFITVDTNVKLEVLDWGGSGRPLVLLTGLGNNAHVYDKFALKLTPSYHVYGITRRGFGASSAPATGYSADRLGDDVLAVLDSLKLNRPVLVGHSIAGEELSSVGSRHPEKVAGLIYLECYGYAYYDRTRGDLNVDLVELLKKLQQLQEGKRPPDPRPLIQDLSETALPGFERDLREAQKDLQPMPAALPAPQPPNPLPGPEQAIWEGVQKYTSIPVPILAIFALPQDAGQAAARTEATTRAQAQAFERGVPSARVVLLPHATHYVFQSNEADVLREMNAFIAALP